MPVSAVFVPEPAPLESRHRFGARKQQRDKPLPHEAKMPASEDGLYNCKPRMFV
jgi:hypothetical protein